MLRWLRRIEMMVWAILILLILFSGIGLWVQLGNELRAGTLRSDFGCYYVTAHIMEQSPTHTYDGSACRTFSLEIGFASTALFCPCLRYPPLFVSLLLPLARMPYDQAIALWTLFNALLATLIVAAGLLLLSRPLGRWRWLLPFCLVLPPVVYNLLIGQVNVLLLLFLLPAMLARPHRSIAGQILAGLGIALAAHLKATWGFLVIFLLLRKRFWAAGAAIAATLLLWAIDLALIGPTFLPGYLASLRSGDQANRLLISGMDGSLWGAAVALFGLYDAAPPAGWVPPAGYTPLQPLLAPVPFLSLLLPALGSLWMFGRSLGLPRHTQPAAGTLRKRFASWWAHLVREEASNELWDHTLLLAVALLMTVVPHSGNHAVMLLFPAFLYLLQRWPAMGGWERLLLGIAVATLLPTTFWINLNAIARPLAWTALPLMAGRICLWYLLLRSRHPAGPAAPAEAGRP